MGRSRRRSFITRKGLPSTLPARVSGPTPCRPATPISRAACGIASRMATRSYTRPRLDLNPDRPHGHAPGNGQCGRVPRQPRCELHHRHQSCRRRRFDARRAVLRPYAAAPSPERQRRPYHYQAPTIDFLIEAPSVYFGSTMLPSRTRAALGQQHIGVDLLEAVIGRHPADQLAIGDARGILHRPRRADGHDELVRSRGAATRWSSP